MSSPTPRAALAGIPAYVPGKPPTARPGVTAYKLSSNENPYPPLSGVLEAVAAAAGSMNRYPDMASTALREALAARAGVGIDQVATGTGSVAVIYHLLQAFCDPGDEVVHAWRSFEAYPIGITAQGATSVPVPLTSDGRHDLEAMAAAVTDRTRVVLLCSPNNPTGPALRHADVVAFLDHVPGQVLVAIDEAYREFVRDDDPLDGVQLAKERENVVALRTFAKAYGLAGLRVGYLIGPEPIAAAVRACSLPFGVSTIAQAAVLASLGVEDELMARVEALVAERDRVTAGLRDQGWAVPDPQGNFVWLDLGARTTDFATFAEAAGITVRPFVDDGVRISIGETAANDVLLGLAGDFRKVHLRNGPGDPG
ncbi:MAG: hisC [Marmoricola sp.]|nr:hisC [Marmoricola sp.]